MVWRFGNDAKSDFLRPQDARPEIVKHIKTSFAERLREQGRTRFLEKSPSNALRMAFIDAVFDDCRFIHIHRNPVDSILSINAQWRMLNHSVVLDHEGRRRLMTRVRNARLGQLPRYLREGLARVLPSIRHVTGIPEWGPRIPGLAAVAGELGTLAASCMQWRVCVESACNYGDTLPGRRYFECKLETITEETIGRLLDFCDLSDAPESRDFFRNHFDGSLPSARRSAASSTELDEISQWTYATAPWLEQRECPTDPEQRDHR